LAGQKEYESELQFTADVQNTGDSLSLTGYESPHTPAGNLPDSDRYITCLLCI